MKFIEALRNASKRIQVDIEDSNLFDHMGERGRFREFAIEKLLRPHIPNSCGIATGLIFEESGDSSKQMDIVLYDQLFGNILFENGDASLFPCESVFGALEVKSKLDSAELDKCIQNAQSLKSLQRTDSTSLDITPFYNLKSGNGLSGTKKK